jgi:hypothetical protein
MSGINLLSTDSLPTDAISFTKTGIFNTDFKLYQVVLSNVNFASDGTSGDNGNLLMTLTVGGTEDTDAADYTSMFIRGSHGFDEADEHNLTTVGWRINQESLGGTAGPQGQRWSGYMYIYGSQESRVTQMTGRGITGSGTGSGDSNGGQQAWIQGCYEQTGVVDGFKLTNSNGSKNFLTGKVSVYGIS